MREKLQNLLNDLHEGLVDREHTLKAALLTLLAGENLVLVGPPGTGKSMVARRIADCLADDGSGAAAGGHSHYFEYLLTKFSTPEEIFGPLSISELKADRFKRNTAGYLPTVKTAFLDEIFKASSSILNALLTILNERIYHNGAEPQKVPLRSLIAASNELPTDQEELSALYDRFLVRVFVDYVSEEKRHLLFAPTPDCTLRAERKITLGDLQHIREAAEAVVIPAEIVQAVQRIWSQHRETFKEDRRENLSDRRLKKLVHLLRVSAATNGRKEIDLSDVFLLKDCLWNHSENRVTVRKMLMEILQGFSRPVPSDALQRSVEREHSELNDRPRGSVNGFKGRGTRDDPILIQTVADLAALEQEEVGKKGYYFLQTEDLDCSAVSPWPLIGFEGHYDGNGKKITRSGGRISFIFLNAHKSSFKEMQLDGVGITRNGDQCAVVNVSGSHVLVESAKDCKIERCKSVLIAKKVERTNIARCEAGQAIAFEIETSSVADCIIYGAKNFVSWYSDGNKTSLIADVYVSALERCYVVGGFSKKSSSSPVYVVGRYRKSGSRWSIGDDEKKKSTVKNCVLGEVILSRGVKLREFVDVDIASAENCVCIHAGSLTCYDARGVSKALVKQRYLEAQMGWDFSRIWDWDEKNDIPRLRDIGCGGSKGAFCDAEISKTGRAVDLLRKQVRENIWL